MRFSLLCVASAWLVACRTSEPTAAPAHARFVIDAPLCGFALPVSFAIDGVFVGTDTFRVNVSPSHKESAAFIVDAGRHTLSARTIGKFEYVWRDTSVYANPGAIAIDTLPFYCS